MRYVISDTHFGHDNIIEYCDRPFSSVEEMNEKMVDNWNSTVDEEDTVLFLGDIRHHPDAFGAAYWFEQLNGKILLVRGNHDGGVGQNAVVNTANSCTITHGRYHFYCKHRPVETNVWQIHGHFHDNDVVEHPFVDSDRKKVNVSAELLNYTPLRMDDLVAILDTGERYRDVDQVDDSLLTGDS